MPKEIVPMILNAGMLMLLDIVGASSTWFGGCDDGA